MKILANRHWWKWTAIALCLAVAGIAFLMLGQKEADIRFIGPRTKSIREMEAWLDRPVDMVHFQNPRSLKATLEKIYELHDAGEEECPIVVDREAFAEAKCSSDLSAIPIHFTGSAGTRSRRQLLEGVLAQVPDRKAVILMRHMGFLEVTTRELARACEQEYYQDYPITVFDKIRQAISEMRGGDGHLPVPPVIPCQSNRGSSLIRPVHQGR